jgi:hypothetical protein
VTRSPAFPRCARAGRRASVPRPTSPASRCRGISPTTATLDRLRELNPKGRFEVRRFRPNIVVQLGSGEKSFAENAWVGHTLAIGDAVRLSITGPCIRCVMTTLPQGDLPRDPGILRTAAQHNKVSVGVYATVERGGTIRRGDAVSVQ